MMRIFKLINVRTLAGPSGVARAMLAVMVVAVVAATMTFAPRESAAKPAFSKSTGKPCTACHTKPPKLNACGKKWKANNNTKC